jgi:hypothetical protein|tara:strand:+ start:335 stop:646 length:312 start_codon:yes stop_codon:yes gene_type:complete
MHVNAYKFEIGDLVTYSPTERDRWGRLITPTEAEERLPRNVHGIVTKKHRQSVYIEARPMKCVEEESYLVVFDEGAGHWVDSSNLIRAQKGDWSQQDAIDKTH